MFQRLRHRRRLCSRHLTFGLFRFDPALNALMFICGSPLSNFTIMPLRNSLRAQGIKQFIEFRPLTNTQAICGSYPLTTGSWEHEESRLPQSLEPVVDFKPR